MKLSASLVLWNEVLASETASGWSSWCWIKSFFKEELKENLGRLHFWQPFLASRCSCQKFFRSSSFFVFLSFLPADGLGVWELHFLCVQEEAKFT